MSAKTNNGSLRGLLTGLRDGRGKSSPASFLHVVAHPDDDLYFMNPEVTQSLRSGAPVTSVYLTSGDSDGHNYRYGTTTGQKGEPDHASYARARQNGLKGAYAAMATGDRTARWTAKKLRLPHGAEAELFTLDRASQVSLIFLNIRQQGLASNGATARLRVLWDNSVPDVPTIVPTGSKTAEYRYTRNELLAALGFLLETYQPTTVRTMDPDPDHQHHDADNPQHHDYGDHSDHQDHTATALFTWQALRTYKGGAEPGRFTVEAYRGYYNERWCGNLMPEALGAKEFFLNLYGNADGYDCGDPAGGGDYAVAFASRGTGWSKATRHRYVGATDWLLPGHDGRLNAFAVLGQKLATWVETAPGSGEWTGPTVVAEGPIAPRLAVELAPDGCFQVFALRLTTLSGDPEEQVREIVTTRQFVPGKTFTPWASLGNPSAPHNRRRQLGTPTVARDGSGRLHLFVRNWGKGVSSRVQGADGEWGNWTDLHGAAVQDGLTAVTAPNGTIDLFGAGKDRVRHWYQSAPDSEVVLAPGFKLSTPADPPTAVVAEDLVQVFYRRPEAAGLFAAAQSEPSGGWNNGPRYISGRGGFGGVAAVPAPSGDGTVLLVARNDFAGLAYQFRRPSTNPLPEPGTETPEAEAPGRGDGSWADLKLPRTGFVHSPAAAFDSDGRAVIAVLGTDGSLHLRRQQEPGLSTFGPWQAISS